MNKQSKHRNWDDLLMGIINDGQSVAIGIFSNEGNLLHANSSMCYFLDTDKENLKPKNFFVNPNFNVFTSDNQNGKLFEGLLTLGNFADISYSLEAKIYKQNNEILVFAEADVPDLFQQNKKMSRLNQEVNNLQRQLIKEKKNLQYTLTELKDTQEMLIHSEKMNALGKLVAGVAHEINNPLSFVYSNIFSLETYTNEIIQSYFKLENTISKNENPELIALIQEIHTKDDIDYLTEDIPDLIKESKTGIERVKTIVEDLRRFSRLDESEIKQIDLIENINSTLTIANVAISQKNINLEITAPEKLIVDCYPGQLNQAILNIIINATQAVNEAGNIWISVTEDQKNIHISIKDDGCGLAETIKPKIFDPFFTTKEIGQGTGLGLSITHKIIHDLHKGKINVISSPGQGANFVVSIPKIINL